MEWYSTFKIWSIHFDILSFFVEGCVLWWRLVISETVNWTLFWYFDLIFILFHHVFSNLLVVSSLLDLLISHPLYPLSLLTFLDFSIEDALIKADLLWTRAGGCCSAFIRIFSVTSW
jgi:hypothetical protein